MEILPAIDLMEGACVRLAQGDFERKTRYTEDPAAQAARFAAAGARWIHVVDLDAARGGGDNRKALAAIAAVPGIRVQAGGGVRKREDAARLFAQGAARVVIGSLAIGDPEAAQGLLDEFGAEAVGFAFDVRRMGGDWRIATHGWRETAAMTLSEALARFGRAGARHALVTDIDRDGMMEGPNTELYAEIAAAHPGWRVQASGGVRSADDVAALDAAGAAGVIIGKALYERRIALEELF
ncbi:MAG: 1-(5-phosphoribosyl)-5-[(5-phosphoribosylamino) methylideneamino]imidazole-4-carboxamide isomerase [Parvularculaceae bacterium]